MVRTGSARGPHGVHMWSIRGPHGVCTWSARGPHVVRTWYTPGVRAEEEGGVSPFLLHPIWELRLLEGGGYPTSLPRADSGSPESARGRKAGYPPPSSNLSSPIYTPGVRAEDQGGVSSFLLHPLLSYIHSQEAGRRGGRGIFPLKTPILELSQPAVG